MAINTTGKTGVSYEEGIQHLRAFPLNKGYEPGYYYALLMEEEDGTYTIVHRTGMPCWGALREYEKGTRPNDPWPEDLMSEYEIFPETGKPVAMAACLARMQAGIPNLPSWVSSAYSPTIDQWNTFIEFAFNKDISPWRKALNNVELIKNEDGAYWGAVFLDTNVDPTIMVNLLRCNALSTALAKNFAQTVADNPGVDMRLCYLASKGIDAYNMSGRIVPERWWHGEPLDLSDGGTFYERYSYNRPENEYLFGGKNNEGIAMYDYYDMPTIAKLKQYFADQLAMEAVG